MKKTREVDYIECDDCKKDTCHRCIICVICGKDLCYNCAKSAPVGPSYLCKQCYDDTGLVDVNAKFSEDWEEHMKKRDAESEALFDKYQTDIDEIIEERKKKSIDEIIEERKKKSDA